MSGPPAGRTLLDLPEPGWRRHLLSGEPAGMADVEPELLDAAAKALGDRSRATQAAARAAHYDLAHSPIEHTVSALLLVWDGAQLLADEAGDLSAALGSPGTRAVITTAA